MHRDVGGPGRAHWHAAPRQAGFALVEVLICALLLALGAATLAGGLRGAWGAAGSAARAAASLGELDDLAEILRAVGPAGRPGAIATWQARLAAAGARSPRVWAQARDGVAAWQVELAWTEPDAPAPIRIVQPVAVAP